MKLKTLLCLLIVLCFCLYSNAEQKPEAGREPNWSHHLTDGLVGLWLFNEGSGDKVYDLSGNSTTGTIIGMIDPPTVDLQGWNPGRTGVTLQFHPQDDYIDLGAATRWNSDVVGTITAWIRFDSFYSANYTRTFFSASDSGDAASMVDFAVWNRNTAPTGPHLVLYIYEASGNKATYYGSSLLTIYTWYFVAVVQDGISPKLYVNGYDDDATSSGSTDPTAWFSTVNDIDFNAIGARKLSGGLDSARTWDGLIEDVRVYNRPLSDDEIMELHYDQYGIFRAVLNTALTWAAVQSAAGGGQIIIIH